MARDISFKTKGSFKNTETFFKKALKKDYMDILKKYGEEGVSELKKNTPVKTGKTASSWYYDIKKTKDYITISWNNSNKSNNIPIVVLLYYGHSMPNGSYIQGIDFINPTLEPIFKKLSESVWEEVTK